MNARLIFKWRHEILYVKVPKWSFLCELLHARHKPLKAALYRSSLVQLRPRDQGFSTDQWGERGSAQSDQGNKVGSGFERFSSDPGVQLGPRGSGDQSRTRGLGIQFRPRDQGISLNQWFMGVQLQPRDQGFSLNQEDWEPRVGA